MHSTNRSARSLVSFNVRPLYWTVLDGRDDDGVGGQFSIPTLVGLEYFDTDDACRAGACAARISGLSPYLSTGIQIIYWTRWGFGLNVSLRLSAGTALFGSVTDAETGAESDLEDSFGYGSSGRMTWGVSF